MRHKSEKDVIVKWRDGSENCVPIKELKCMRKGAKINCIGSKVKMYYEKKWYYGVVTMTEEDTQTVTKNYNNVEREGSSDDEPLINIVKQKYKEVAEQYEDEDPYRDVDIENLQDPDYVIKPEKKRKASYSSNETICLQDLPCDSVLTTNVSESTKQNINFYREQHCEYFGCHSEIFSSCHRCHILLCWKHFINDFACDMHGELMSQNSTLLPSNKEYEHAEYATKQSDILHAIEKPQISEIQNQICEVAGCNKQVNSSCFVCGILVCWDHFSDITCDYHRQNLSQSLMEPIDCTERVISSTTFPDNFEDEESTREVVPETQNQLCEVAGCKKLVISSCFECGILVCSDHFNDVNCNDHRHVLSPTMIQPNIGIEGIISSTTPIFPEEFEVEGSPREVPRTKTKKHDVRKTNHLMKNLGQQHTTQVLKKIVPERKIGPTCQVFDCKRDCYRFTNEIRENIFKCYWGQGNLQSQREYIVRYVKKEPVKRRTAGPQSKRQTTIKYFFPLDGQSLQVCQTFFLNTLGISSRTVRTTLDKITHAGTIDKERRGGRKTCFIENDAAIRKLVEDHIDRFPKVESHYCREDSSKEYLHSDLTLPKMYHMFKEENKNNRVKPSFSSYRRVFKSKNLAFHRPKKDQCSLCMTYLQGSEEEKLKICEKYEKHQQEKTLFRAERKKCKLESQQHPTKIKCATFDLQQVINLPISKENAVFYKRRLSAYNFTIYDLASGDCSCYTWHEGASKRGSAEISTSLYDYLMKSDEKGMSTVYLFADGCSGQNKNSIVASTLLYVINNCINIQEIILRFSVPCHGQSEGDSVHSTISYALKKSGDIFVPSQLPPIFRLARRNKPYEVNALAYTDFLDFKKLSVDIRLLSVREDDEGQSVNWTEMVEFSVNKKETKKLFFKTSHAEQASRSLSILRKGSVFLTKNIGVLNPMPPKIPLAKYNDLISLTTGDTPVIRLPEHVAFYTSLSH